jgi:hypothetical protein
VASHSTSADSNWRYESQQHWSELADADHHDSDKEQGGIPQHLLELHALAMKKLPEQVAVKQAAPEFVAKAVPTHITVATFTCSPSPNYNINANSQFNGNAHFNAIANYTANSNFNTAAAFLGMSAFSSMQPQRSEPPLAILARCMACSKLVKTSTELRLDCPSQNNIFLWPMCSQQQR